MIIIVAECGQVERDRYGNQFQWLICPDCEKPRWVKIERGQLARSTRLIMVQLSPRDTTLAISKGMLMP